MEAFDLVKGGTKTKIHHDIIFKDLYHIISNMINVLKVFQDNDMLLVITTFVLTSVISVFEITNNI